MNLPETLPLEITSYINGHWKSVANQLQSDIVFPADGRSIATLYEADADEVGEAVAAAKTTFESGVWSRASVAQRKQVLRRVHELIIERTNLLASHEVAHTGSPVAQALGRHIPRAALNFEFFAEYISQSSNPVFEQNPDYVTYVTRSPVGVAGLIAPWNAPLALATMKVAGAIAFGNSCVLKPSELTPVSFVPLMQIFEDAGLPPGVVNMVNGQGPITGQALVNHADVGVIAFTGGTATGRLIGAAAGQGIKKVVTELGGKSANIIFADADLERALDAALVAIFSNNGQQCLAGSRILLQESIAEEFTARFVERVEALKLGNPYDTSTEIGPLISQGQLDRVLGYATQARQSKGIEVLTGGEPASGFAAGFYMQPTVVRAANNALAICQEEVFGPFATLLTFNDADEAFAIANDSEFGLVGYVWSNNVQTVMRATEALRAGTIWVNTPLTREIRAPFGGFKHSGVGRDGGDWSRALFTEEKTITIPTREFPIAKLGMQGK
jgi:5-carboxymethyl-2-hydroxymuconic-semialdehyde dehydrogenase/aminomuconate-semialdehyde/2-hydroxymuconate-6-semialdehyde dehydrogenase